MSMPQDAKPMTFLVTADRAKAKAFYGGTLGFAMTHEDEFAADFDLNGVPLRLSTVEAHIAQPHTVLGWQAAAIEAAVQALRKKGVVLTVYEGLGQDEHAVWSPCGGARVAWFTDPDGHVLSLAQL